MVNSQTMGLKEPIYRTVSPYKSIDIRELHNSLAFFYKAFLELDNNWHGGSVDWRTTTHRADSLWDKVTPLIFKAIECLGESHKGAEKNIADKAYDLSGRIRMRAALYVGPKKAMGGRREIEDPYTELRSHSILN